MKFANIRFELSGEVTWKSKSGKTERRRAVRKGDILNAVKVIPSEFVDNQFDIADGNWTIQGLPANAFTVLDNVTV